MSLTEDILNFWFNHITDQTPIDRKAMPFKKWFSSTPALDEEIRQRFETHWHKACAGQYKDLEQTPEGRLALIVLWDQFSRNMFRGTPQMYASDPLALELSLRSIQEGIDKQLLLIYRTFLAMPMMHAENLEIQSKSVAYFENLITECRQVNPANIGYYEYSLTFAQGHHKDIQTHGRFPYRDLIIGR